MNGAGVGWSPWPLMDGRVPTSRLGSDPGENDELGSDPGENDELGSDPGENDELGSDPGENDELGSDPGENDELGSDPALRLMPWLCRPDWCTVTLIDGVAELVVRLIVEFAL